MAVTYLFAGLPVSDFAGAQDWYTRLLGREADMLPHETEAVWRLTPNSAIYVVEDSARAGSGLVTVALDDLDEQADRMREMRIDFTELQADNAPRRLKVTDLDGNTLTFFDDPGQRP